MMLAWMGGSRKRWRLAKHSKVMTQSRTRSTVAAARQRRATREKEAVRKLKKARWNKDWEGSMDLATIRLFEDDASSRRASAVRAREQSPAATTPRSCRTVPEENTEAVVHQENGLPGDHQCE